MTVVRVPFFSIQRDGWRIGHRADAPHVASREEVTKEGVGLFFAIQNVVC